MNRREQAEKVLEYWYIMELFQPNSYPIKQKEKTDKKKKKTMRYKEYFVKLPRQGDFASWLESSNSENLPVLATELEICYGKLPVYLFFNKLYQLLNIEDLEIEIPAGNICLFAFRVSLEGEYVEKSFQISPFAWAISNCIKAKKTNMDSLTASGISSYAESFERLLLNKEISVGDKIRQIYRDIADDLLFFVERELLQQADYGDLIFNRYQDQKTCDTMELNRKFYSDLRLSYVLEDLETVKKSLKDGDEILAYVNCLYEKNENRINIRDDKAEITNWCQPQYYPLGRWPSKFSPALMQQLAINIGGVQKDGVGKVFSVNGPPGTGKTTLLKEVIVSNIIEKAEFLATYENSDDAFTVTAFTNCYDEFTKNFFKIDEKLTEYGILVASYNNGAVENITKALPDSESVNKEHALTALFDIDETKEQLEWKEYIDGKLVKKEYPEIYFSHLAEKMFGDAWGLISVPLGKQSNIKAFFNNVLSKLIYMTNDEIDTHKGKFQIAKSKFLEQVSKVQKMQNEIQEFLEKEKELAQEECLYQKNKELKESEVCCLHKEINTIDLDLKEYEQVITANRQKLQNQYKERELITKQIVEKREEIINWEDRLGFMEKLLVRWYKTEKMIYIEELKREKEHLNNVLKLQDINIGKSENEVTDKQKAYEQLLSSKESKQECIQAIIRKGEKEKATIEEHKSDFSNIKELWNQKNMVFLDEDFFDNLKKKEIQEKNPLTYEDYNKEREILFYRALVLQREFVLSSRSIFTNFRTISKIWGVLLDKEKEPYHFSTEDKTLAFKHVFNSLFLLVPVISTTFASVQSLLKNVRSQGSLGLLIVDEAGQAAPQMAVGALWRAKRAMVVGDPKQIEPVVTLPKCVYEVVEDSFYQPYKNKMLSIQSFADNINQFSGRLQEKVAGETIDVWVGCPLVIHRRCIEPMFSISNAISYNGTMVNATRQPDCEIEVSMLNDKSLWIQVEGKEKGDKNHYVREQGEKVTELLLQSIVARNALPNLYIISPFKSVITELKDHLQMVSEFAQIEEWDKWVDSHCGTVHTFQGKEANEVIFILGCDKGAIRAVKWVNTNLVNVAVTRAKYRLYVIGDYEIWKASELFWFVRQCLER